MNIDSARKGERRVSLRSLFTAILLMVVALAAILGLTSTKALAAENNTSIVPDSPQEVVLASTATGDVNQPVTDADYAKLNAQYKVTPTGTPTIQSKTQNVETLQTKDGNKDKSYTKTTTKWVVSDEDKTPAKANTQVNPGNDTKIGPNVFAPINLFPSVPALLGGAALGAVPALAAVPAAFVAGGVLPTVGALAAVPAAYVAGKAARTLPAALAGAALAAKPAFDAGKLAAAIPAVLAAKPVFDAGKLAGAAALALPAKLALRNAGAVHALLNPLSFGGPIYRTIKGFNFPLIEITKDHIEDVAVPAFLAGTTANALKVGLPVTIIAFVDGARRALGAVHALTNPLSFGGPLFRLGKGFLFPIAETLKDHAEDLLLANVLPKLAKLGAAAVITPVVLGRIALGVIGGLHALTNPFSFPFGVGPLAQLGKLILGNLFPITAIANDHLQDALRNLALAFVAGQLSKIPAIIGAALVGVIPALIGLHFLNDALRNGLIAAVAVPAAIINGLTALILGNLLGAKLLNDLLKDILRGLALLTLANLLNPLSPFNPFVGTGLLSLVLRALRTVLVAVLAGVDALLTVILTLTVPTLFAFGARLGLALLGLVPGLLVGIFALLRDIATLNLPRLLADVLLGVGALLTTVGFVLAPLLKFLLVYVLAYPVTLLVTALALILGDAFIQILKDIVRTAIVLGAVGALIGLALVDGFVAIFATVDGLLDALAGALYALAHLDPIKSALAIAYVFSNLTELYIGLAGGLTLFAVEVVGFLNLGLLELVAALD